MNRSLIILLLCVYSAMSSFQIHAAEEKPSRPIISSELKSLSAVSDYLSDDILKVKGREFVMSQVTEYSVYYPEKKNGYGWRDTGGTIHFPNGSSSQSKTYKPLDFKKHCEQVFKPYLKKRTKVEIQEEAFENSLNRTQQHITPALAAIWLHRLGEAEQAQVYWKVNVQMLEAIKQSPQRKGKPPIDPWEDFLSHLGGNSPWWLFETAVGAHMHDRSDLALKLLTKLKKISPASLKKFGNGDHFLADLQRRTKEKTIRLIPEKNLPLKFKSWDLEKRIHFLISKLDQVNELQNGQPGGVDFASDWRVSELISIGDPAIPALIDCLEMDKRLTRSCHYWRAYHPARTILSVREAVLTAIMSILQEPLYKTASTGSNFTLTEATQTEELVKYLRDYWKKNGETERFQRFMNRLTDTKSSIDSRLDALELLAWSDHSFTFGTTFATDGVTRNQQHDKHPLLNRFSEPTLVEAAWALTKETLSEVVKSDLDDDAFDKKEATERAAENYAFILSAIAKIKDPRIVSEITKAYKKETSTLIKLQLASTADACGESDLIIDFSTKFLTGTLDYKPQDLVEIINIMTQFRHTKCEQMLDAFTNEKHRYYKPILAGLLTNNNPFEKDEDAFESQSIHWKHHPFAIKVLTDQLDNKKLTEEWLQVTEDGFDNPADPFASYDDFMTADWLKTQKHTKEKVQLRVCDIAAIRLQEIIYDLPFYSPLVVEKDKAFAEFQQLLKKQPVLELPEKLARHLGQGEYIRRHQLYPVGAWSDTDTKKTKQRRFPLHFDKRGKIKTFDPPAMTYLLKDNDQADLSNPIILIQVEKSLKEGEEIYGCIDIYGMSMYHSDEIKSPKL